MALATVAVILTACAPAGGETLPAATLVRAPDLDTRLTPLPIQPTPDSEATPLPPVQPLGLVAVWQSDFETRIADSVLSDLTDGGYPDIVAAGGGSVRALDAEGAPYWQAEAGPAALSITPAELDGIAPREFIVARDDNQIQALSSDGETLWEADAGGRVAALGAVDFDGDSIESAVVGLWGGTVAAYETDGAEVWRVEIADGGDVTAMAAGDVDADGTPEVVVGTSAGAVEVLDANGGRLWAVGVGTAIGDVAVVDLDGGGRSEVVVATQDGQVQVYEGDRMPRWSVTVGGALTSVLVAQMDGEGGPEILVGGGHAPGRVAALDADGRAMWIVELDGGVRSLAAGQLDADGAVEVVAGTDDGQVVVLDAFGQVRGTYAAAAPVTRLYVDRFIANGGPDVVVVSGSTITYLRPAPTGSPGDVPPAGPVTLIAPPDDMLHPTGDGEVEIVIAGDVTLTGEVVESAMDYGAFYPFQATSALLRRADVAAVNLAGVLANDGEPAVKDDLFRAPPRMAQGLQLAGVDVVFLANDHTLDFGQAGLDEMDGVLGQHGLHGVGAGANREAALTPVIIEANGVRIAFLAVSDDLPGGWAARFDAPGVADANTGRLELAVREAARQADVVVVGIQMGEAGRSGPTVRQQSLAQTAINAGADLVAGYGTGTVMEAGPFRDGFVAYGLGGFVVDGPPREGAVLRAVVTQDGLKTVDLISTHAALDGQARFVGETLPEITRLLPRGVTFRAPQFNADPGPTPDYRLDVDLDYDEKRLEVVQAVTARNDSEDTWTDFVFSVAPNYFEETFEQDIFELSGASVTQQSSERGVEVELDEGETVLRVETPEPVPPGAWATIELRFTLTPPPVFPTDWQPYGTLSWDEKVLQAGEWYPVLVPYVEGEGWREWEYYPVGDPVIYTRADYEMTVRASPGVIVVSGGEVSRPGNDGNAWQFRLKNARGVGLLASPTFGCANREVRGVTLRSCYQPEHEVAGRAVLDMAERAVTLFSELFGPYLHDDLALAENAYYGAMEYSGTLSITEPAYVLYNGVPDTLLEALVVHEVAHMWWYDAVGNDQISEPWLDESLATYSELLYYEHYYPDFTAWWWNYRVLQFEPSGPVDVTIYDHVQTEPFVRTMYGQAAFFLQDMRRLMGDPAFFAFLQDYYVSGSGELMTADDFFAVARRHTDQDLSDLLSGYFRNPDH